MVPDTINVPSHIQEAIDVLLPLLRKWVSGEYAISLAGSYAKGTADE